MIEPKVFSVGQINRYIKNLLENDFILNSLLVQGEISNFKAHTSGHWYFTLKDAQGAISGVIFKQDAAQIPFDPEKPFVTSGIRIGTPAVTTRGMKEDAMLKIADFIERGVALRDDVEALKKLGEEVKAFTAAYPMPQF